FASDGAAWPRRTAGEGAKNADQRALISVEDATRETHITQQQVSRWRKALDAALNRPDASSLPPRKMRKVVCPLISPASRPPRGPDTGIEPGSCEKLADGLKQARQSRSAHRESQAMMFLTGFDIFVLIVVLLAVLTLYLGVKTVPQGYNWTIERF